MFHTVSSVSGNFLTLIVCLYCALRGGRPEKIVAVFLIFDALFIYLLQDREHWLDPQHRLLLNDLIVFVVFSVMVSTTRRRWMIPETALQILCILLHFLVIWRPGVHAYTYMSGLVALNYAEMVVFAFGAWQVGVLRDRARRPEAALK